VQEIPLLTALSLYSIQGFTHLAKDSHGEMKMLIHPLAENFPQRSILFAIKPPLGQAWWLIPVIPAI
jgi:hypothetical protein